MQDHLARHGATCLRHARAATIAFLASLTVLLGLSAAPSHAQTGDLRGIPGPAYQDYFGCGMHMTSEATYLRSDHRVVGNSVLRNDCQLAGFHGAVQWTLRDAQDRVVAAGLSHRFGVDGRGPCVPKVVGFWPPKVTWVCPPTVVRTEGWAESVDPSAASRATGLILQQYRAPGSWEEKLAAFKRHVDLAVATGQSASAFMAQAKLLLG